MKTSFSQRQSTLHHDCLILLQQIESNKLNRISIEMDAMKWQHDPMILPNVKAMHIDQCQEELAKLDVQRMELLNQYADLMQQLIEPVINKLTAHGDGNRDNHE